MVLCAWTTVGEAPAQVDTGGWRASRAPGERMVRCYSSSCHACESHQAVCRIVNPEGNGVKSCGTGTLIDTDLVLTCWHLFADDGGQGPVTCRFHDGQTLIGQVIRLDNVDDLGLIRLDRPPSIPPVRLASTDAMSGTLTACGYGQNNRYKCSNGRLVGFGVMGAAQNSDGALDGAPTMRITADTESGDSGGPVFNASGELAGVIWGEGAAVPIQSIRRFLGQYCPGGGCVGGYCPVQPQPCRPMVPVRPQPTQPLPGPGIEPERPVVGNRDFEGIERRIEQLHDAWRESTDQWGEYRASVERRLVEIEKRDLQGPAGPPGPPGPAGPSGTGKQGPQGEQGPKGDGYVLTDADKAEIAALVLQRLESLSPDEAAVLARRIQPHLDPIYFRHRDGPTGTIYRPDEPVRLGEGYEFRRWPMGSLGASSKP